MLLFNSFKYIITGNNLITKSDKRSLNFFSETKYDDKFWVKTYILTFLSKSHRLSKVFKQYSQVQKIPPKNNNNNNNNKKSSKSKSNLKFNIVQYILPW